MEPFIEGAQGLSFPFNADYNGARQDGVGYYQRVIHKGRRFSAYRSFLHPVHGRTNLSVRTNAHAAAVLFEGKRAMGVRYFSGGKGGSERNFKARQEVILSGGALNTPRLLQISGVGPGNLLNDLGTNMVNDLPGIGENLRDHYAIRMVAQVRGVNAINEMSRAPRL